MLTNNDAVDHCKAIGVYDSYPVINCSRYEKLFISPHLPSPPTPLLHILSLPIIFLFPVLLPSDAAAPRFCILSLSYPISDMTLNDVVSALSSKTVYLHQTIDLFQHGSSSVTALGKV